MSQTLLIADDSMPMHTLIKTQLEPDALSCHSVYDGEAAISTASSLHPDLILLDVDMPRLDGFEVCRRLKANPLTGDIPVIFLTADSMLNDSVKGFDCGAMDYIAKPFRPDDLKARVHSALRTRKLSGQARMIDGLTGLWNRAYFNLQLSAQLSLSRRLKRPMCCIVTDVEPPRSTDAKNKKAMENEIFHAAGDVLRTQCRIEDIICRLEAGKFALLLQATDRRAGARMAERLLHELEKQFQSHGEGVTCSLGVADTIGGGDMLQQRADAAAIQAKQLGRNCVAIAREATAQSDA
jgi:two-component system, cell cycle response regulator